MKVLNYTVRIEMELADSVREFQYWTRYKRDGQWYRNVICEADDSIFIFVHQSDWDSFMASCASAGMELREIQG